MSQHSSMPAQGQMSSPEAGSGPISVRGDEEVTWTPEPTEQPAMAPAATVYTAQAGDHALRLFNHRHTQNWYLDIDGSRSEMVGKPTLEDAQAFVADALAVPGDLEEAVASLQQWQAFEEWKLEALGQIFDGCFGAPGRDIGDRESEIRVNLEAVAQALIAMGWEIDREGRAHAAWRQRAEGRWINQDGVLWLQRAGERPGNGFIRVERGRVLEVIQDPQGGIPVSAAGTAWPEAPDERRCMRSLG